MYLFILLIILLIIIALVICFIRRKTYSAGAEESDQILKSLPDYGELIKLMKSNSIVRSKPAKLRENEFWKYILDKLKITKYSNFLDIDGNGKLASELLDRNKLSTGVLLGDPKLPEVKRLTIVKSIPADISPDLICIECPDLSRKSAAEKFQLLQKLSPGGSLIWVLHYKGSGSFLMNIMELIDSHFGFAKIVSDNIHTPGQTTAYIYAGNFVGSVSDQLLEEFTSGDIFTEKTLDKYKSSANSLIRDVVTYYKSGHKSEKN